MFMVQSTSGVEWQRAIVLLSGTVISVVVIGVLYFAQSIFIPVTLAVFLTFLLNPLVSRLRALGLSRTPAVIVTVGSAALVRFERLDRHGPDLESLARIARTHRDGEGEGEVAQAVRRGVGPHRADDR
jgi:hypothetical protein